MLKCNEYTVKDISISCSDFDIKKLEIYGDYIFEKNEIVKKIKNAVEEFLNYNKDVDYLVAYYYPTYDDMKNNLALCCIILSQNIKNINLTYENIHQKLIWNEYYDFFSASKKAIKTPYSNVLNEANKMLQVVEEAYFIIYELLIEVNYKDPAKSNNLQERLERWLIRAEHINKYLYKLKPIVNYDFVCLMRHMNDILYYCYVSQHNEISNMKSNEQLMIDKEIVNVIDKFKIIHQQLTDFIKRYSNKETNNDIIKLFLEENFEEKRR